MEKDLFGKRICLLVFGCHKRPPFVVAIEYHAEVGQKCEIVASRIKRSEIKVVVGVAMLDNSDSLLLFKLGQESQQFSARHIFKKSVGTEQFLCLIGGDLPEDDGENLVPLFVRHGTGEGKIPKICMDKPCQMFGNLAAVHGESNLFADAFV